MLRACLEAKPSVFDSFTRYEPARSTSIKRDTLLPVVAVKVRTVTSNNVWARLDRVVERRGAARLSLVGQRKKALNVCICGNFEFLTLDRKSPHEAVLDG